MAKLISMMNTSLDGYTEDEHGGFGWTAPQDEEVHTWIFAHVSSFRTCLYGRRVYETMLYWETAHTVPDQPQFVLDFARQWQAAEKIVYSRTLAEPRSARTKIERSSLSIPMGSASSRQMSRATSLWPVLNSPRRRSRQGLSTSSKCVSAQWSSAAENGTSRVVCGWIWSWSTSGGSATGRSFCGMRSAASRSEGWNVTRQA